MLMRCTAGVETDYVDSTAFVPIGGDPCPRYYRESMEPRERPETTETDPYPVTILDSARDEFAPRSGRVLAHASGFAPFCGRVRVDRGCVSVRSSRPQAFDCQLAGPPVSGNDFIKQ